MSWDYLSPLDLRSPLFPILYALFKVCFSALARRKQMINKFKLVSFFNSLSPASQLVSKCRRKWIETKKVLLFTKKKYIKDIIFHLDVSLYICVFISEIRNCKTNFVHPLQVRLSWPWPLWGKKIKLNWTLESCTHRLTITLRCHLGSDFCIACWT